MAFSAHRNSLPALRPWDALGSRLWLALLMVLLGSALYCQPVRAQSAAGEVERAHGPTSRLSRHQLNAPVRSGSPVRAGDRFRTGPDARLELVMRDGARLSIGPNSEFAVDDYHFRDGEQRAFYTLMRGLLRTVSGAIGKLHHEDFRLSTPTAVMGIRGTDFTIEQADCDAGQACALGDPGSARLRVTVHQGRVAVSNSAGSVEVPQGASLTVDGSNSPPRLEPSGASGSSRQHRARALAPARFDYQPVLENDFARSR